MNRYGQGSVVCCMLRAHECVHTISGWMSIVTRVASCDRYIYFYAELMYLYSLYITDPLESSELNALIVFLEVVLEVVLEVLGRLLVAFLSLDGEGREGALVRLGSFLQCVLYAAVWGCCSCRLPFVLVNRIHWSVGPPCLPRLTSTFPFGRHGRL